MSKQHEFAPNQPNVLQWGDSQTTHTIPDGYFDAIRHGLHNLIPNVDAGTAGQPEQVTTDSASASPYRRPLLFEDDDDRTGEIAAPLRPGKQPKQIDIIVRRITPTGSSPFREDRYTVHGNKHGKIEQSTFFLDSLDTDTTERTPDIAGKIYDHDSRTASVADMTGLLKAVRDAR